MFKTLGKAGNSSFLQYNDNEWRLGNRAMCDLADGDCSKCEALVADSRRFRKDVEGREHQKDKEVERQFEFRLSDLRFWREELDKQVAGLQDSNDCLTRLKTRTKAASEGCDFGMKTTREVIVRRDARKGLDLVADEAYRQLQKYLSLLYDTQAILDRNVTMTDEQMRTNRAVTHQLLRDMDDKYTAITIDYNALSECRDIGKLQSLKFDQDLLRPVKGAVTLADWESYTKHNLEKSELERSNSAKLQAFLEQVLKQSYEDLDLQRRKVLRAIKQKIKDTEEAQKQLENRLGRLNEQISDQNSDLDRLQLSKDESMSRLKLCQSRLKDRRHRPRMELVWDSVQLELEKDVALLCNNIKALDDKIRESRQSLQQMKQTQLGLQKQIEQKKDTIFVDQTALNALSQISHCNY